MADALRAFEEVKEELADISGMDEYTNLVERLVAIKSALGSHPEGPRVGKEIRSLRERLPAIHERERTNQEFHVGARIAKVEQNAPRCKCGHTMVIRRDPEDRPFWGCPEYPRCWHKKQLTQRALSELKLR